MNRITLPEPVEGNVGFDKLSLRCQSYRLQDYLKVRLSAAIFLLCTLTTQLAFTADPDIHGYSTGIWSIANSGKSSCWVVIHNLEEAKTTGIYHIEVIQRAAKAPVWSIKRVVRHMAISKAALTRSVRKPLKNGAVYPESFYDAFNKWKAENGGAGGHVCDTSVVECMSTSEN